MTAGSGSRLTHLLGPHLLAALILASGLGATTALWTVARRDALRDLQADFDYRSREVVNNLALRMATHLQVVRGAQGLFAGSTDVSRIEFADYIRTQDLTGQFPGMRGVGYMDMVRNGDLAAHVARMKAAGFPRYSIRPAGERAEYAPVTWLEPAGGSNARMLGFDAWAEPVRRATLEQARDTGLPTMSGRIVLQQDDGADRYGFIVVLPVYRHDAPAGTLEQRRAAVRGFVYGAFNMRDMLAAMNADASGELDVEVYDGDTADPQARMSPGTTHAPSLLMTEQRISTANHRWTLAIRALPSFGNHLHSGRARNILWAGIPATLLLTLLTWLLATSRAAAARALEGERQLGAELDAGQRRLAALHDAAQRGQAMMRSILDSTVDGILVDNGRHRILDSNQRFRELWSVPPEMALAEDDTALIAHMLAQLLHPAPFVYSRSLDYDEGRVQRELLRLKDGRFFEQFTRAVRLGSETARVWSFRDVTERKQVEQRERTHRHVLEMLARGAPLHSILDAVVLGIETTNPGMLCAIMLLDADGQRLRNGAAPSLPKFFRDAWDGLVIGHGVGSCGTAAKSGTRVIVDDIATHPYWEGARDVAAQAGIAAAWAEPIRGAAGKIIGTFAIYHREPHYPSPANVVLIEQAAQLAGIAIEQTLAAQALRAGEERFRSLYDHAPVALWELDWSGVRAACEVLRGRAGMADLRGYLREHPDDVRALASLVRILDLNSAALAQVGGRTKDLEMLSLAQVFGEPGLDLFIDAVAALQGGARHFAGEGRFMRLDGTTRANQVTLLVMPGHEQLDFLIVSTLDITERQRMDAELRLLATTDFLTGLPNRREFMARLDEELARVQRHVDGQAAVLMLDIDHFKTINDRHGHPVGDAVLRHVAELMRSTQRKIDTLGRMGGEEFAVLLPGAGHAAAAAYAERLRHTVAASPCRLEDGEEIAVTVSIGCAEIRAFDPTGDAALLRADKALYGAKAAGRNRVECEGPA
ncbi:sensor domain-containing diguanylate cyclase [Zemynaea arenosa]|uniref:sensor domain-containing diguanylate cyclase n=1 Tax=Zemynaea arenosa TaxID=2561931 RepID=UPI001E2EC9B7|nr:CHASE domain-containing protein [Massilia arenosa]